MQNSTSENNMNGLGLVITACFGIIAFICLDVFGAHWSGEYSGIIVTRQYVPSVTSTGVGTTVGANGQVGTVVTSSTEPEKWLVIVNVDGQTVAAEASPALWSQAVEKQLCKLRYSKGLITGCNYGWSVSEIP